MPVITPHNWSPEAHQMATLCSEARFKVLVWHRKAHKTTFALNELIRWAANVKGVYWYVAPYLSQARRIVWEDPEMLPKYVPPDIWKTRNNQNMHITFPNGSMLYVLGADHPDSLRGPNPMGVVLDEYDDMKPEIWTAILQPIAMSNPDAWVWFTGTPKGQRDLFRKWIFAQDEANKSWFASLLTVHDTRLILPENLEEARNSTTEDFFKQEYECAFLEGAGSFFRNIDANIWDGELVIDRNRRYQIGVDLAKFRDYTVLTPFDLTTFEVGKPERFNQIDYTLQKARIEAMYLRLNRGRIVVDSTGVGEPIYEDLVERGIRNIEPYQFTEKSRRDLLTNLQILIEQGTIKLPNDETLLNELRTTQYNLSDRGKVKIGVPDSMHDDCVMSLALAVWDIPKKRYPVFVPEGEEEIKIPFCDYRPL